MSLAPPQMRHFAKQLVAYEADFNPHSADEGPIAFSVIDKLSPHFITLMGSYGFQVMLERALAQAGEEVTWLRKISVNHEGQFDQLCELKEPMAAEIIFEGKVVFIAYVLEQLITFLGESFTLRMLRDVWPKVSSKDLNMNEGVKK
ncbi:MAG: hypothetical protein WCL19_07455 [Verrucomicrobiota bacterium]